MTKRRRPGREGIVEVAPEIAPGIETKKRQKPRPGVIVEVAPPVNNKE